MPKRGKAKASGGSAGGLEGAAADMASAVGSAAGGGRTKAPNYPNVNDYPHFTLCLLVLSKLPEQ
jgi:hypothetical protein